MQFSQANNKLRELFNQTSLNYSTLKEQDNNQILLTFFKNSNKPFVILEDSGWLVGTPNRTTSLSTTKGTLVQDILSIDVNTRLEMPEQFLPYLDVLPFVKSQPNITVDTFNSVQSSYWSGDTFVIKVDNNVVWSGPKLINPANSGYVPYWSSTQLDTYLVPSSNRKKIWTVDLRWNDGTNDWKLVGQLLYIDNREDAGTGCDGAVTSQWNSYRFRCFTGDHFSEFFAKKETWDKYAVIDNLTTTSISGKCYVDRVRSVSDGGGGCNISNSTSTTNTSVTVALFQSRNQNQASSYVIQGTLYKKIGANYVGQSSGIIREFLFPSYNPYFDSVSLAGYVPTYTADGDGWPWHFYNGTQNDYYLQTGAMPETSASTPSNYVITHQRNPEDNSGTSVDRSDFYLRAGWSFSMLGGFTNNFGTTGNALQTSKGIFLVAQPQSGVINTYQIFYRAGISIFSKANYNLNEGQSDKGNLTVNPSAFFPAAKKGDTYRAYDPIVGIGGALKNASGGTFVVNQGDTIICVKDTNGSDDSAWVKTYTVVQNDTYKTNAQNFITPGAFWGLDSPHNSIEDNRDGRTNDIYISENVDIEYKIMLVLRNPYFFQETRTYDLAQ